MDRKENETSTYPLPQTMSEFIYSNLKKSIINNELKANQRINEKELANRFHVSRTPVREAVLRLAAEGFVRIDSYKRALVKEISFEDLKEILEVLGYLDSLAIGLVIEKITPDIIDGLEKITNKMKKYCDPNSAENYMKLNEEFHSEIWKHVPNKFLKEILLFVKDKRARYSYARIFLYNKPEFLIKSLKEHEMLMKYIKQKDKEKLRVLMIKHRNILLKYSTRTDKEELKKFIMRETETNT